MSDLKPCPFCGSDDVSEHPDRPTVYCEQCDCEGPYQNSCIGDGAKAWNTRAEPTRPEMMAELPASEYDKRMVRGQQALELLEEYRQRCIQAGKSQPDWLIDGPWMLQKANDLLEQKP